MKVLKINEVFTEETMDRLVLFYNLFDLNGNDKALIYLNSRGGDYPAMEAMLDLINKHGKITTLAGYGTLASSGFELFFMAKCKKYLIGGCVGMYHQSSISVIMNENWKPDYKEDEAKAEYMKTFMKIATIQICDKLNFTREEKSEIKKGNQVWFQPSRMNEFLVYG